MHNLNDPDIGKSPVTTGLLTTTCPNTFQQTKWHKVIIVTKSVVGDNTVMKKYNLNLQIVIHNGSLSTKLHTCTLIFM